MKNITLRIVCILLFAVIAIPWHGHADAQPKAKDPPAKKSPVMVRKLQHAQGLLKGIALQDFEALTRESDALIACRNEVTWRLDETEQYLAHSNEFLDKLQSLKSAAKKKDIESATLCYLEVTRTCIKCHDHLRKTRGDKKDN
jgi:hypothetical protein